MYLKALGKLTHSSCDEQCYCAECVSSNLPYCHILGKWRNISNITTALQQGKNMFLKVQMLGDHSVSLWPFKWPTERLYNQDASSPANISVTNAHHVLRAVWAAKRGVPLLGTWGWAICWLPAATWGAGTATRGAGSARTACTTESSIAARLCQNGCVTSEKHSAVMNLLMCRGEYDGYMPYGHTTWQTDVRDNLWPSTTPVLSLNNPFSPRSLEVCVGKVSWATTGTGQLCVCTFRLWANIS